MFLFLIHSVERLNDKLDVSNKKAISSSELLCLSCDVLLLQKIIKVHIDFTLLYAGSYSGGAWVPLSFWEWQRRQRVHGTPQM